MKSYSKFKTFQSRKSQTSDRGLCENASDNIVYEKGGRFVQWSWVNNSHSWQRSVRSWRCRTAQGIGWGWVSCTLYPEYMYLTPFRHSVGQVSIIRPQVRMNIPFIAVHSGLVSMCVLSRIKITWHYNDVIMSTMVSRNHRRLNCLLNHLFGRRSKKTSKPRIAGLCEGNWAMIGEFPAQRTSNAERYIHS